MKERREDALVKFIATLIGGTVAICAFVAIVVPFWWFVSYQEAKAYNRITGAQVTTWEAMFVELRVQAPPKP